MKRFIFVFMTLFTMFSFVSYGQNVTLTQEQYDMLPQNVKDEINLDKKLIKHQNIFLGERKLVWQLMKL